MDLLIITALVAGIIILLYVGNKYELFCQPTSQHPPMSQPISLGSWLRQPTKPSSASVCTSPFSYDKNDIKANSNYVEWFKANFPANKNACGLGYDNPFIFPYNYDINLNWPVNRFKYPGWIRQVDLDANHWMNFPGNVY